MTIQSGKCTARKTARRLAVRRAGAKDIGKALTNFQNEDRLNPLRAQFSFENWYLSSFFSGDCCVSAARYVHVAGIRNLKAVRSLF